MYHTIKFTAARLVDLEVARKKPLERVLIGADICLRAQRCGCCMRGCRRMTPGRQLATSSAATCAISSR